MVFRTLVKTSVITVDGRAYTIHYFATTTPHGTQRYSCELALGPDDRIIVDGGSLGDLEWRVARLMPATIYSRALAARAIAA
jgi:hypothetical protein